MSTHPNEDDGKGISQQPTQEPPLQRQDSALSQLVGSTHKGIKGEIGARPANSDANKPSEEAKWEKRQFAIQTTLGIIGVIALFIYYGQLVEMRESTDAATEAIKLAKENTRLDQRAWVTITAAALDKPLAVGEAPVVKLNIVNSGRTPALDYRVSGAVFVRDELTASAISRSQTADPRNSPVSTGVIGPGATSSTTIVGKEPIANEDALERIQTGRWAIYASGRITYLDVFRDPHITTFCASISGKKELEDRLLRSCKTGNTAD